MKELITYRIKSFVLVVCFSLTCAFAFVGCSPATLTFKTKSPVFKSNYGEIIATEDTSSGSAQIKYFYYKPSDGSISGYISSKQCTYNVSGNKFTGVIKNISYGTAKIQGYVKSDFSKITCYGVSYYS